MLPRRRRIIADAGTQRPQHPGRTVDEFGQGADDPDREFLSDLGLGDQLDELQPLDTVIITMRIKIARDQKFEPASDASRRKHGGEDNNAAE